MVATPTTVQNGVLAMVLGTLGATLRVLTVLAERGLLTKRDVLDVEHSMQTPFQELLGGADEPEIEKLCAVFDAQIAPVLARLHRAARDDEKPARD